MGYRNAIVEGWVEIQNVKFLKFELRLDMINHMNFDQLQVAVVGWIQRFELRPQIY